MNVATIRPWHLALGAFVVSAVGGLLSGKPKNAERKVYTKELKQAPWAPPPWAFGPAWVVNNYFLLNALKGIINLKENDPLRKKLIQLQVPIWFIFFTFGFLYFEKKSPVLAATWTVADAILAIASFSTALKADKKLALNFVPLSAWTMFASSLAIYQVVKNDDVLLGTAAPA